MAVEKEYPGHPDLTGGGEITLHSHAGGGGGSTLTVCETEVFYGTAPTIIWADLDLSSAVGVNSALVMLRFSAGEDINAVAVRRKGDTSNYYSAAHDANAYGLALGHHDFQANALVLMTTTDTSGVIQWRAEADASNTRVTILAYIA